MNSAIGAGLKKKKKNAWNIQTQNVDVIQT